jgi:hypothetical protein
LCNFPIFEKIDNMKLHVGLGILFLAVICCHAQGQSPFFKSAKQIQSDTLYENVLVRRLFGDEKATGFVIWIKHKVPAHYHEAHSETVTILKGKAEMILGAEQNDRSKRGHHFHSPRNASCRDGEKRRTQSAFHPSTSV